MNKDIEKPLDDRLWADLMLYGYCVMRNTERSVERVDPRDIIIGLKDQCIDLESSDGS